MPYERPSSLESREQIVNTVLEHLEKELEKFEGEDFHNPNHSRDVNVDARAILEIFKKYIEAAPSTELVVDVAAKGHDSIINYSVVDQKDAFNYGQRVRYRGFGETMPPNVKAILESKGGPIKGNEELSSDKIEEIVKVSDSSGQVFTAEIMQDIKDAVSATYPDARPDTLPDGATLIEDPTTNGKTDLAPYLGKDANGKSTAFKFSQPFLTPDSKISTLAIALGDLSYAGRCDAETFNDRGNSEWREINELIRTDLAGGVEQLAPERKAQIAKSAISWVESQIGFLLWQKVRFEEIVANFKAIDGSSNPDALRQDLHNEYSQFDSNLLSSKARVDRIRQTYSTLTNPETYRTNPESAQQFNDLLEEMGVSL